MADFTLPDLVGWTLGVLLIGAALVGLLAYALVRLYRLWRRIRRTVHDLGDWLLWHG